MYDHYSYNFMQQLFIIAKCYSIVLPIIIPYLTLILIIEHTLMFVLYQELHGLISR